MLTVDLVRTRTRGDLVIPRFVRVEDEALQKNASALIGLFQAHRGQKVAALEQAISAHIGTSPDFMIQRGLVKLLFDRSTVAADAPLSPEVLRRQLFTRAATRWPVSPIARAELVAEVADAFDLTSETVETHLYGDLKGEERLMEVEEIGVESLLHRYNLAQAQAVLLRAREVSVTLPGLKAKQARALFRALKFHRLMYRARKVKRTYSLQLDGPLSLFRNTTRYGLQLALFLPALAHLDAWELEAQVAWGRERTDMTFRLCQDDGLRSHTRQKGVWTGEEERHFEKGWRRLKTSWKLQKNVEILNLDGRGVLIPDYRVTHPDGRVALLDIVWHWRARTFAKHLDLVREAGPSNLIIGLASRLQVDDAEERPEHPRLFSFKGVISPKRVLALVEEVALPGSK